MLNMPFQIQMILSVLIAVLIGGIVGLERELAGKPAGLRTHMLVAGAAAFLVKLTHVLIFTVSNAESSESIVIQTDPVRIIQAIIIGFSFIGAGTIIQRRTEERVEGLTTAASILFTTGLGIAVACNQYIASIGVALIILIVNSVFNFIPDWIKSRLDKKK